MTEQHIQDLRHARHMMEALSKSGDADTTMYRLLAIAVAALEYAQEQSVAAAVGTPDRVLVEDAHRRLEELIR